MGVKKAAVVWRGTTPWATVEEDDWLGWQKWGWENWQNGDDRWQRGGFTKNREEFPIPGVKEENSRSRSNWERTGINGLESA